MQVSMMQEMQQKYQIVFSMWIEHLAYLIVPYNNFQCIQLSLLIDLDIKIKMIPKRHSMSMDATNSLCLRQFSLQATICRHWHYTYSGH